MEDKALRGIPWTVLGYAVGKAITVGATIVLARLLTPSDFGLVALALVTVESTKYLTGLGIGPALIVRHDLGPKAAGTGLTLMVVIGLASGALLALGAPLLASAFGERRLSPIVATLATTIPLASLASFYSTIIQRELEFRRRFLTQAAQVAAYAGVSIAMAFAGAGVWSLVGGQVASSVALLAAVLALTPYRVRPAFDGATARHLCSTGAGFTVQVMSSLLQHNVDYLAIGRLLGPHPLGMYTMAFRLSELPYYAIADPVAQVSFPGFSRMRSRGEDIRATFLGLLQVVAVASVPFGIVLSSAAEPFTRAVLGEQWLPMVGALSVLGLWGALRPAETMLGWLLNAVGHARAVAVRSMLMAVLLLPAVSLAAAWSGIVAVSWMVLGGLVAFAIALSATVRRRLGIGLAEQWRSVRTAAIGGAAGWVAGRLATVLTDGLPAPVALAVAVLAVFAAYLATVSVTEPALLGHVRRDVQRMLGRPPVAPVVDPAGAASIGAVGPTIETATQLPSADDRS